VNHVPERALAAIDDLGEGLLVGEPRPVDARLRSDLRLVIAPDEAALAAGTATVEFRIEHGRREPDIGAYGSFVSTVVEGIERRLREWGVQPPATYDYRDTADGWHRYAGAATLP
jgi:hypothetical protein